MSDKEFLEKYNANDYQHPSVAVDVVILALDRDFDLNVLLVNRTQQPFKDFRQLPGGFVDMNKSLEDCVKEKVLEKTKLKMSSIEQLYTYGEVNRDPRTRVISVVYYAILPQGSVEGSTAYLADGAYWKKISKINPELFAFDHAKILNDTVNRLKGKLSYCDLAFDFLRDKNSFTLFEMNKVYTAILNENLGLANFRRDFIKRYNGRLEKLEETNSDLSKRPSATYKLLEVI